LFEVGVATQDNDYYANNQPQTMSIRSSSSFCLDCLELGMAYTLVYKEIRENISPSFVPGFDDAFYLFSASTNKEKADWINGFAQAMIGIDGNGNTDFLCDVRLLLTFYCLELVHNVDTNLFSCNVITL
jgi:hypothetical protein